MKIQANCEGQTEEFFECLADEADEIKISDNKDGTIKFSASIDLTNRRKWWQFWYSFNTVQKAAFSFLLYGLILLVNSGLYSFQTDDFTKIHRVAIRIFGVCLISYGLWNYQRWAWWFGIVASIVITLFGFAGVFFGIIIGPNVIAQRIIPTLDFVFLGATFFSLGLTIRYLLMKTSRDLIRNK